MMILPKEIKLGSEMAWLDTCSARDTIYRSNSYFYWKDYVIKFTELEN